MSITTHATVVMISSSQGRTGPLAGAQSLGLVVIYHAPW
jgi:hypothetical protein